MEKPRVFVVICAYGVWGSSIRSPKEIVGYGMYLRNCLDAIQSLTSCGYEVVAIPCGGAKLDDIIESVSIMDIIEAELGDSVSVEPDRLSLTTPANIDCANRIIGPREGRILVLCDEPREVKVRWLVEKIFRRQEVEVVAFLRPDINPKSNKWFQKLETIALALVPGLLQKRINMINATVLK